MGNNLVAEQAEADPVALAPFDWTCAFFLDSILPVSQILRLRLRSSGCGSRELGRADLLLDLREAAAKCRARLCDQCGHRIGIIRLSFEVRHVSLADICTNGLNLGRVVDTPDLADISGDQEISVPLLQG